jgi:Protein kinase domain
MSTPQLCPQCGKPLPTDAPKALCPSCLLAAALAGQSEIHAPTAATLNTVRGAAIASGAPIRVRYFGDYELTEEIARGGMGVVWKARQISLNRDVAVKMIRNGALAGPEEIARFLREAQAAANLQHPNIVAIHEVGEHGGQHYFSMDYVQGRDLASLVKEAPLSAQAATRYLKIIAEAIHFAHQRGTLHRDLKPQNVLIDGNDQPRVTDFGLAKFMKDDSGMTHTGMIMGSPSYMPPEQAAGRHGDVGPTSDVYALGAILYELLTGRPPFRESTALATMRQVLETDPVAPRRLKADIPLDLETICLKCLEKSPAARYPSARALVEELERFQKGEPILARPAGLVQKTVGWIRRNPGTLAALTALVVVTLVFSLVYLFEENAFLRAAQADPGLVRAQGPRQVALNVWNMITCWAVFAGIYLFLIVRAQQLGVTFKEMFNPMNLTRPIQPLSERSRRILLGAGLALIACGVVLLTTAIGAYVWEDAAIVGAVLPIYGAIFFGIAMFVSLIQDYRLVRYGAPSTSDRRLTAEQSEPIRKALEDRNWSAAIKRYREEIPEAGLAEATFYVNRLFDTLHAREPNRYIRAPLPLTALNWKAALICALLEAVVLTVIWFAAPPAHPVSTVASFAYTFLFGVGVMAGARVKGFWKRVLLLTPALAVGILAEILVSSAGESTPRTVAPYVFGYVCGVLLMAAAFNQK